MIIVKCGCSRQIHLFPSDKSKCPFCGGDVKAKGAAGNAPDNGLSPLSGMLSAIDKSISLKDFDEARRLIDDALELMPGWEIGEIPGSGELHWRKLLAETSCRSDAELLLKKKKPLSDHAAFVNAERYASGNERHVYALVKKTDELIARNLTEALDESELEAKGETGVKGALAEFGRELGKLKAAVQKSIGHLDEIEKSIREQFMDCTASSDEFRYALEELLAEATKMGKGIELEISAEQKSDGEAVFERILADSRAELERFKYFIANDEGHFVFARLVGEQKAACEKIMKAKAEIEKINADAEELLESFEKVTKDYTNARADVSKGVFSRAARLLSKERFNDEVSSAMQSAKAG